MPHAELNYSSDIKLDAAAILSRIENVIQHHDATSGECKGRAYPAPVFHHSHVFVDISMLPKDHRDQAFVDTLMRDLKQAITEMIDIPCFFSLNIGFSGVSYVTGLHQP